MNRFIQFVAASSIFVPIPSPALDEIDVLLVFAQDSGLSNFEKVETAKRYQFVTRAAFNTINGSRTVNVLPLISPTMSYTAQNKTDRQAISWMKSQNGNLSSPLRIARGAWGSGGSDLVLMVASKFSNGSCGSTEPMDSSNPPPTSIHWRESEKFAFAVVAHRKGEPGCNEEIVVPHELGHLLYAEHEPHLITSNSYSDNNDNLYLPDPRNHAVAHGSRKSLMWNGLANGVVPYFSGSLPGLEGPYADNATFIDSKSWDVVAAYRVPASPQITCFAQSLGANKYQVSWAPTNSQPVNEVIFDRKVGSTWRHFATSAEVCIPTPGCSDFRVQARNANGMSNICFTHTSCHDGGGFEF